MKHLKSKTVPWDWRQNGVKTQLTDWRPNEKNMEATSRTQRTLGELAKKEKGLLHLSGEPQGKAQNESSAPRLAGRGGRRKNWARPYFVSP